MSVTAIFDYSDGDDFTPDTPANLDFNTLGVEAVDLTPSSATFWAKFSEQIDGNGGGGDLSATLIGTPTITGGKLDLTGHNAEYVDYDATGNADTQQQFTIEFDLTTNYSTKPSTSWQNFVVLMDGPSTDNLLELKQSTSAGQLQIRWRDENGSAILTQTLASWSPTAGTEYRFSLNVNLDAGETRLFIGTPGGAMVQHGITMTPTATRSSAIGLLRVGSDNLGNDTPDFSMRNLVFYSQVMRTAPYTSEVYDLPDDQYSVAERMLANTKLFSTGMTGFSESISGETVTRKATHYFVVDGAPVYHDGADWVTSDQTVSQSNAAAEILANVSALPVVNTVCLFTWLQTDGLGTAVLSSVSVDYAYNPPPIDVDVIAVVGYAYHNGNPLESGTVTATLKSQTDGTSVNVKFVPLPDAATTGADGGWTLSLPRTDEMESGCYVFEFKTAEGLTVARDKKQVTGTGDFVDYDDLEDCI